MKKPAFITRVRSARKLGQEAMERAEAKANEHVADFSARALAHIQTVARSLGPDGRVREGLIVPVGFAPRVKGHGTAGGRVYARGEGV